MPFVLAIDGLKHANDTAVPKAEFVVVPLGWEGYLVIELAVAELLGDAGDVIGDCIAAVGQRLHGGVLGLDDVEVAQQDVWVALLVAIAKELGNGLDFVRAVKHALLPLTEVHMDGAQVELEPAALERDHKGCTGELKLSLFALSL